LFDRKVILTGTSTEGCFRQRFFQDCKNPAGESFGLAGLFLECWVPECWVLNTEVVVFHVEH
jgi:hypothetical protein